MPHLSPIGRRRFAVRRPFSSGRAHRRTRPVPVQEPADSAQPCSVHVFRRSSGLTVHVTGELDLAGAETLRRTLRALERGAERIEVDLSAVNFADSFGLEPLAESALRRSSAGSAPLQVRALSPAVQRVVALLGADWSSAVRGEAWLPDDGGPSTLAG